MHIPVNHPARRFYRVIAGLVGVYVLVFGLVGLVQNWGDPLFARDSTWTLGLKTNLGFALASIAWGALLLVGVSRKGNLGHRMNLAAGIVFLVTGMLMMAFLQTDANILNFSMVNVIVSLVFGLILFATGLYGRVGSPEAEAAERRARTESVPPPEPARPPQRQARQRPRRAPGGAAG